MENSKSEKKTTAVITRQLDKKYSLCEKLLQPHFQK